jgi:rhodanese-related sulfurtransferase
MKKFFSQLDKKIKTTPWPVMMPQQFNQLLENDTHLAVVDVRDEFDCCFEDKRLDAQHVYHVPFNDFVTEIVKHDFDTYDYIVIMCTAGPKGAVAANILRWMGNEKAFFVKGGVEEFGRFSNRI